jgi:CRISPR/Cas system-associated endonuclease Cas1
VKSGDPSNIEAQAAKVYWGDWPGGPVCLDSKENGDNQEKAEQEKIETTEANSLFALLPPVQVTKTEQHQVEREPFHRDPDGNDPLNGMLNYGYAVLRAGVGRAVVAAGLHPALGIHHANRSNAFCLADDLLEPLRPLVDRAVRELHRAGKREVDRQAKAKLIQLLTTTVSVEDQTGPLMVALHRTVASLIACYEGQAKSLCLAEWPGVEG